MELKAVFFDLDDTLYTSFQACDAYAYERIAAYAQQTLGLDGDEFVRVFHAYRQKLARQQPGMPPIHDRVLVAQGALERVGKNTVHHARALHRVYWDAVMEKMTLRPGVHELLTELRQAGVKTAVCTDMLADIQLEKLERLGLAEQVDYLASSEEAGMDKPGSPIFWLALQKCGCTAAQGVMVGDNFRHDVQGALDAGLDAIWLNWTDLPRPDDNRPWQQAKDFTEIAALLRARL